MNAQTGRGECDEWSASIGRHAEGRVHQPVRLRRERGDASVPVTLAATLDALEARHPALRGAIRDQITGQRRSLIRFFACKKDFSNTPLDALLPDAIATGDEPLLVVGAIAGG